METLEEVMAMLGVISPRHVINAVRWAICSETAHRKEDMEDQPNITGLQSVRIPTIRAVTAGRRTGQDIGS